jgi:hypothetical protein
MSDVNTVKALLSQAGVEFEENRTGASEGGLRTCLIVTHKETGTKIYLGFSGHGTFSSIDSIEDSGLRRALEDATITLENIVAEENHSDQRNSSVAQMARSSLKQARKVLDR